MFRFSFTNNITSVAFILRFTSGFWHLPKHWMPSKATWVAFSAQYRITPAQSCKRNTSQRSHGVQYVAKYNKYKLREKGLTWWRTDWTFCVWSEIPNNRYLSKHLKKKKEKKLYRLKYFKWFVMFIWNIQTHKILSHLELTVFNPRDHDTDACLL